MKTVFRNFVFLSIADVVNRIAGFVLTIVVVRELGASVFGQLTFALAFTAYFNLFADFGLGVVGTRDIAKNKENTNILGGNILVIQFVLACVLFIVLVIATFLLPLDNRTRFITITYGFSMIPIALNAGYIFQAHEKMEYLSAVRIITQIVYLLLSFVFIFLFADIIYLPVSQLIASIIGAIVVYLLLRRVINFQLFKPKWADLRSMMLRGIPFVVGVFLVQIYHSSDQVLIKFLRSDIELGWYGVSNKIIFLLLSITTMFSAAVFPRLAVLSSDTKVFKEKLLSCFFYISLIVFPLTVGGIVVSSSLISTLFGIEYQPAVVPLMILFVFLLFAFLSNLVHTSLITLNLQMWSVRAFLIGAVVNIVFNLLLIPTYGIPAAAGTTVLAEAIVLSLLLYKLKSEVNVKNLELVSTVMKPFLAAAVMGAILICLQKYFHLTNLYGLFVVGVIVYSCILYFMGISPKMVIGFFRTSKSYD